MQLRTFLRSTGLVLGILLLITSGHSGTGLAEVISTPPLDPPHPEIIAVIDSSTPAYPGAEGWGAESIGGRGGRVIEVTNLNDSGPGSLRAAIEAKGPRIVVFRVAGVIQLESTIRLSQPYITIAGQTAPGGGITIAGGLIQVSTHNVIVRYLRWRGLGPGLGGPGFISFRAFDNLHDVIVDHCSASWNWDDNIDGYFNNPAKPDMRNITVQNCLIAEALSVHPTAMLFSGGVMTDRLHHISIHDNLFVHNGWRNPRIKALHTEVINNVVYNWRHRMGSSVWGDQTDWINNYWLAGPMSESTHILLHEPPGEDPLSSIYIAGNVVPSLGLVEPNVDNWFLVRENDTGYANTSQAHRRFTPLVPAPVPVSVEPAEDIFNRVVMEAGANRRLNGDGTFSDNRDAVDQRLAADVLNGTGPSSLSELEDAGSIPPIDPGTAYIDSDHDGMPDEWEYLWGFHPCDSSDGPGDADGDGYTNVEEFLNGTDPGSGTATGICLNFFLPFLGK